MRTEAPNVTDELLLAAKKEFLEKGFLNASLRQIASKCNVSTNSIYTRFKDKEGLFEAIVGNSANELMKIYLEATNNARNALDTNEVINIGDHGTNSVIDYIYNSFDEFNLIFCCSQGTKYEGYFDELAKIEEDFYKWFVKKYSKNTIDDFFIHVICRNGWQGVYELVSHKRSYNEALIFMKNFTLFNHHGWMVLLEARAE